MKNRGFFLFLIGAFTLICIYNITATVIRISTDAKLNAMTSEVRSEWLKDEDNRNNFKWAEENSFSLGLDLQGGMFVTLEVGIDEVLASLASNPSDPTLVKALAAARKQQLTSQDGFVSLFVTALQKEAPNAKLAVFFAKGENQISYNSTDGEVIAMLNSKLDAAFENSVQVLRTRIEQFGVDSPTLQASPSTGRVLIELPGVKDADRVRRLLRGTAELGFWPCYRGGEAFNYLIAVNERVRVIKGLTADTTQTDSAKAAQAPKDTTAAADTTQSFTDAIGQGDAKDSTAAAKDSLSQDEQVVKFKKENPFFGLLSPPSQEMLQNSSSPIVGYALASDTAAINKYLALPEIRSILPSDLKLLWTAKPESEENPYYVMIAVKGSREGVAPLTGDVIVDAKQEFGQTGNEPEVTMSMNVDGAKIWKKMTTEYSGQSIAIVLDNLVYTYPTVNDPIPNGRSSISGSFTIDEAKDLANVLKAGKLRAPVRIEGEEIVGPTLGEATTQRGLYSFIAGFIAVVAFMMLYYRSSGVVASIALFINLVFVIGVSSAFHITMTLPGIAGILLALGMAVDANVLIYERIREELEEGRSVRSAISVGFSKALSAIIDGHVTPLITAFILTVVGTGPIKGFGVTLIIGVLTSMISAVVITRVIIDYRVTKSEGKTLSFGSAAAARFFKRIKLDFITNRKRSYAILVTLIVASLAAMLFLGFKLGVDFKGGRQYIVEFSQMPESLDKVRSDLKTAFDGEEPIVKTIGAKAEIMVTTAYKLGEPESEKIVQEKLLAGMNTSYSSLKPTIIKSTNIGPTVARDIRDSAVNAVLFSLLGIFLYIIIRFRRWQFALSAVLSLAFNVLMVLGVFALLGQFTLPFSVEVDQSFIAAILTIVGYTITDTVVVFDRIRETMHDDKTHHDLGWLFNKALNDTLSRTIITPTTVLITAIVMFIFAGSVLQGFMLAMIIGVIVGTFSTLFLASPLALDLLKRFLTVSAPATGSKQPALSTK